MDNQNVPASTQQQQIQDITVPNPTSPDLPKSGMLENHKRSLIFSGLIILTAMLAIGYYLWKYTKLTQSEEKKPQRDEVVKVQPTPTTYIKPTMAPIDPQINHTFSLFRKNADGTTTSVFNETSTPNRAESTIFTWGDYIFYAPQITGNTYTGGSPYKLFIHNMKTGATRDIGASLGKGEFFARYYLLNNELYFGLFDDSKLYHLSYPPEGEPQLVSAEFTYTLLFNAVHQVNDQYFLSFGFGDACSGSQVLYSLDTANKSLKNIHSTSLGCVDESNQLIGFKDKDHAYVFRKVKQPDQSPEDILPKAESIYEMDLNNNDSKTTIISKESLPEGVIIAKFLQSSNSIILTDDSDFFVYSIPSGEMKKFSKNPELYSTSFVSDVDANTACITTHDNVSLVYTHIDIHTGVQTNQKIPCIEQDSQQVLPQGRLVKFYDQLSFLQLPDNYSIEIVPVP